MLEEVQGDPPFRTEDHRLGDARFPASLGVGQPVLGQVEVPVEERVEILRHVAQMDRDHTVVDLARGPAVLALDAGSLVPFLGKARLVDVGDGVGVGVARHDLRLKLVASHQVVPQVQADKFLEGPRRDPGLQSDGGDVLALQIADLAPDVGPEVLAAGLGLNAWCKRTYERVQLLPQRLQPLRVHALILRRVPVKTHGPSGYLVG